MRGQVALEYVIISSFALIIVTGLLYTALAVQQRTTQQAAQQSLTNIADTLQQELLLAASVHDGYRRTFSLPPDADGKQYTISNYSSSFILRIDGYSESRRTPAYQGAPSIGENTITKNNGSVIFE